MRALIMLKDAMFQPIVAGILALLAFMGARLWDSLRAVELQATATETKVNDQEKSVNQRLDVIYGDVHEIKQDVKELVKESRK